MKRTVCKIHGAKTDRTEGKSSSTKIVGNFNTPFIIMDRRLGRI